MCKAGGGGQQRDSHRAAPTCEHHLSSFPQSVPHGRGGCCRFCVMLTCSSQPRLAFTLIPLSLVFPNCIWFCCSRERGFLDRVSSVFLPCSPLLLQSQALLCFLSSHIYHPPSSCQHAPPTSERQWGSGSPLPPSVASISSPTGSSSSLPCRPLHAVLKLAQLMFGYTTEALTGEGLPDIAGALKKSFRGCSPPVPSLLMALV